VAGEVLTVEVTGAGPASSRRTTAADQIVSSSTVQETKARGGGERESVCVLQLRDGGENDLGLGRGCGRRFYMTAWCWPGGRAGHRAAHSTGSCPCPCCVMGQGGGPCTGLRVVLAWARCLPCQTGACHRLMGRLEIYRTLLAAWLLPRSAT
jgi:hypothetical protein